MKIENHAISILTPEEIEKINREVKKITKDLIKEVKTEWGFLGDFFIKTIMRIFRKKATVMFKIHPSRLQLVAKVKFPLLGLEQVRDIELDEQLEVLKRPTVEHFNYLRSFFDNTTDEVIKRMFLSLMYKYSVMEYNFILENIDEIAGVVQDKHIRFHGIDFRYKKYSMLKQKLIEKGRYYE